MASAIVSHALPRRGPSDTVRSVQFRTSLYIAGTVVLAFGVALTLVADLGLGPSDVFIGVIADRLAVGHGTASSIFIGAMFVTGLLLGARPGPGTIITIGVLGPVINIVETMLGDLLTTELLVPRFLMGIAGLAVICLGVALVICADVGRGSTELLVDRLALRTGQRTAVVRTGLESTLLVSGIALSGPVGPITLVVAIGIGPGIVAAVRLCERFIEGEIPVERMRRIRHRISRLR